jgi:hypothetical protein
MGAKPPIPLSYHVRASRGTGSFPLAVQFVFFVIAAALVVLLGFLTLRKQPVSRPTLRETFQALAMSKDGVSICVTVYGPETPQNKTAIQNAVKSHTARELLYKRYPMPLPVESTSLFLPSDSPVFADPHPGEFPGMR